MITFCSSSSYNKIYFIKQILFKKLQKIYLLLYYIYVFLRFLYPKNTEHISCIAYLKTRMYMNHDDDVTRQTEPTFEL